MANLYPNISEGDRVSPSEHGPCHGEHGNMYHDFLPYLVTALCSIPLLVLGYTYVWKRIWSLIWNSLTVTVELSGPRLDHNYTERLYHWYLEWFVKHHKELPQSVAKAESEQDEYGKTTERVDSLPGYGTVVDFKYKGEWIRMERFSTPEIRCQDLSYEKILLTSYRRNRALIYQLLEECKPVRKEEDEKKIVIYGVNQGSWTQIGHPKRRRPLTSVILAEDTKEKLMSDVKEFKSSEDWYTDRGIAYRRGYLLYGPPGCGKSSFIKCIAGEIGYDICVLSLTARGLTDDTLNMLMNSTPEDCIILLEDVDAAFRSREDTSASNREQNLSFEGLAPCSTVTFGGLLNALDGVASTEGRLVFMTTNYVERLDPAMVRPGRVDMKLMVDYPNDDQLAGIFGRFYPDTDTELRTEFVKKIRELGTSISMAVVQGLFMFHKESGREAIDDIKNYFKDQVMVNGTDEKKNTTKGIYC